MRRVIKTPNWRATLASPAWRARMAIATAAALLASPCAGEDRATPVSVTPLRIATGQSDAPLFTRIPAEASGVNAPNPYDDPEMWGRRHAEFSGGPAGTGLAVGDFDGDGRPDLYVVNKTAPNRLYRQTAAFVFEDVTAAAGVAGGPAWGTGATFADVDGDGRLDLYVCQLRAPNLYFRNNGDGTFTERAAAAGIAVVAGSVMGAFEDYDRDGDLDLFLLTNVGDAARAPEGDGDSLFRNNGDGTFTDVTAEAGIAVAADRGHSATWWDADNDGWPDLHVANDFQTPDHQYRNNRDGTFTDVAAAVLPHLPWFSMGADFGDINNDGHFDLLVADMAGTTHLKRQTFALGHGAVAEHMDRQPAPQYALNALYLNDGCGRFLEVAQLAGLARTDWTWSVRWADFDNDGWEDLHVTNGMVRDFANADLVARLGQANSPAQAMAIARNSPVLREENRVFRNRGALQFDDTTEAWGLSDPGVSFGAVAADLDGDGDLDLAYTNFEQPVSLYRNESAASRIVVALEGRGANSHAVGARLFATTSSGRQSRRLTLARGALSTGPAEAHFGIESADTVERLEIHWPDGRVQIASGLAANRRYVFGEPPGPVATTAAERRDEGPRLMETSRETGLAFVRRELPADARGPDASLPMRRDRLGGGAAFGDANGDGHSDVYFTGARGQAGALHLSDGAGGFACDPKPQPWDERIPAEEMAAVWLDANGDGALDLLVTSGGVEHAEGDGELADRLYLNDGAGKFRPAPAGAVDAAPVASSVVAAADFDRDGDLDVFIGGSSAAGQYPLSARSRLLENRAGEFVAVALDRAPALDTLARVNAAIWSDANDDGWPDLLVAAEWAPIRILLNRAGRGFAETTAEAGLAARPGWWSAIEAADVDRDGDTDYIVGNAGLNTPYRASATEPVRLYFGDFDDSGENQIVEAYYEGGRLLPRAPRATLARALPLLRRKYPTSGDFGRAELGEMIELEGALELNATELGSGVWLNDGAAHFEFRLLPRLAQAAPVFGLAARDFDGDGWTDILLAQNFHGPQPGTPRFDGGRGLLLRGVGGGRFEAVPAAESGVELPGESRGMAVGDVNRDGWPDAVVVRTNAPAVTLVNRAASGGRRSFAVALHGPPGNPHAIGAAITVVHRDGTRQRTELAAGAGYLSQSEPLAFFGYRQDALPEKIGIRWPDGRLEWEPWREGARLEFAERVRR